MIASSVTSRVAAPVFSRVQFNRPAPRRAALVVRAEDPAAPQASQVDKEVVEYVKTLPGISQPFPNIFDPLNLLGNASAAKDKIAEVKRWREAEITHGRVSMLAALGFVAQEQVIDSNARPFPHVEGPAINHFQQVETQGAVFWLPLLLVIAVAESYRVAVGWSTPNSADFYTLRDDYQPGNLGFDPLGLFPSDPAAQYELQTKELNNGRLAMISVAAFVAQELRNETPIFANLSPGTNGTPLQ